MCQIKNISPILIIGICIFVLKASHAFDFRQCPKWLADYEQFHIANRDQPNAKYLVAAQQVQTKNGLGDRVRGMLFAARVAASTKRVLLFRWTAPEVDISHFWKPSRGINWTIAGTPAESIDLDATTADVDIHVWGVSRKRAEIIKAREEVANSGFSQFSKQFLILRSNEFPNATCKDCVDVSTNMDAVCIFQYLFQPTDEVQRQADEQLRLLYGPDMSYVANQGYAAMHLRLGGQHGEPEEASYRFAASKLTTLTSSIRCGKWLAKSAGIDTSRVPLLLLTDSNDLRRFTQDGMLTYVTTTHFEAVHFGVEKNSTLQQRISVFVDVTMLAQSSCFLLSPSGFSMTAWYQSGGKKCVMELRDCVETCLHDPSSKFCK